VQKSQHVIRILGKNLDPVRVCVDFDQLYKLTIAEFQAWLFKQHLTMISKS
jgi:hypothetical protein